MSEVRPDTTGGAARAFWPQDFLNWLEVVSKVALLGGVILGGWWGYFEYTDRLAQARVAETLKYAERFDTGELREAADRLGFAWFAKKAQLSLVRSAPVDDRTGMLAQLVDDVLTDTQWATAAGVPVRGLLREVDRITEFFGGLEICVEAGPCDRTTANAFFGDYASRFYCLHLPFIANKRKTYNSSYAAELRAFVAKVKDSDDPDARCTEHLRR